MSIPGPSPETLEALRKKIDAAFDDYGVVHLLLETWGRVDARGAPSGGHLYRSWPLRLDDFDDATILSIGGIGAMALPLAHAEAQLYFAAPGTVTSAPPGEPLSQAVRKAISRCLGHGTDLAIWVNSEDEEIATRSGATSVIHPNPILDATWHRFRLIYQSLVPAGAVWVAGTNAGTVVHHPDDAGHRIQVGVQQSDGVRALDVRARLSVGRRDPASLERITIQR